MPSYSFCISCAGHLIRNWKNRFFVLQMANEGSRKVFRMLYYKEQANYEDTPPQGAITIPGASVAPSDAPAGFFGFTVTTAKGKAYPMRVQSELDRATWLQRIQQAMTADQLPNYSVAAPSSGEVAAAAAVGKPVAGLQELSGPASGGRRGSVKPMHISSSISVTDFDLLKVRMISFFCCDLWSAYVLGLCMAASRAACRGFACRVSRAACRVSRVQVVGKGAFGKVFLVKKRDGLKAEQLFAMKVLDKEVITQKGQVAHTKVTPKRLAPRSSRVALAVPAVAAAAAAFA